MNPSPQLDNLAKARRLATFISTLEQFEIPASLTGYTHMGALLADAITQAGVNYEFVVAPRVRRVLDLFPSATTTSAVLQLVRTYGPEHFLNWRHHEKPRRLTDVAIHLHRHRIQSVSELSQWLCGDSARASLLSIRGIGPKTVDYMAKLTGRPTVAVDRHLWLFMSCAGVKPADYDSAKRVIESAADLLGVPRGALDSAIWGFMATKASDGSFLGQACKAAESSALGAPMPAVFGF